MAFIQIIALDVNREAFFSNSKMFAFVTSAYLLF